MSGYGFASSLKAARGAASLDEPLKLLELGQDSLLIRDDRAQRGLILQNGRLILLDRFLIGLDAALIGEDRFLILQNLFLIADHVGFGHWQISFGRAIG